MRQWWGRHLNLWCIAAANLARWRARTIALLVPLALMMGVAASMTLVKDGCQRDAQLSATMLPDITVQQLLAGRVDRVNLALAGEIRKLPHVTRVVPRVWGYIPVRLEGRDVAYTIMGLDLAHMPVAEDIGLAVERGRFLRSSDKGKAVVGEAFARAFRARVGDRIRVEAPYRGETAFELVGVFSSPVQIYTADLMLITLADAREFFGYLEAEASDLCVYLDDPARADTTARAIAAARPELRALTRDALKDLVSQAYGSRSGVFQTLWLILLVTVMLVAWAQASSVGLQMRHDIGVLKALGWETADVVEVRMLEAAIIGCAGTLVGLAAGFGYLLLGAPGIKQYFLGWAVVFPEFPLPILVRPASLGLLAMIGILPLLAATVVPAWLGAITEPDEAIRSS